MASLYFAFGVRLRAGHGSDSLLSLLPPVFCCCPPASTLNLVFNGFLRIVSGLFSLVHFRVVELQIPVRSRRRCWAKLRMNSLELFLHKDKSSVASLYPLSLQKKRASYDEDVCIQAHGEAWTYVMKTTHFGRYHSR